MTITEKNVAKIKESLDEWERGGFQSSYNLSCIGKHESCYRYTVAEMLEIIKSYEVKHWWKSNSFYGFQGDGVRVVTNYSDCDVHIVIMCSTNPDDRGASYLPKHRMPSCLHSKINARVHDVCVEIHSCLSELVRQFEDEELRKLKIQKEIDQEIINNWS